MRTRANRKIHRNHFTMYSPRMRLYNCIWKFTIGDRDDHPSVPHGHSIEKGYRLNAWTGEVFPKGCERQQPIGNLKRKELAALHRDPNFIAFAKTQIEWYHTEFPNIKFYVPEWFEAMINRCYKAHRIQIDVHESFVFKGSVYIKTNITKSAFPSNHK